MNSFWYKIWFILYFVGMGMIVPQVSPFIFTELKIIHPGLIFFVAQLTMPLGSLLTGYISDKTMHVRFIALPMTVGAALFIFLLTSFPSIQQSYFIVLLFYTAISFCMGGIIPLVNISYIQNGHSTDFFGRTRLYGTLGFAIPNFFLLFIHTSPGVIIKISSFFILISALILFKLPRGRQHHISGRNHITIAHVAELLSSPVFLIFMLINLVFYFGYSTTEFVISNYVGKIPFYFQPVPMIWLLGTSVEIIFFYISPSIVRRVGSLYIIAGGLLAGVLRFAILANVNLSAEVIIYSQGLHGIQFAGTYLGSLLYLKEKTSPQRLATAQALFLMFARSLGTAAGGYFLGNIASENNYSLLFALAALSGIISFVFLLIFSKYEKKYKHFVKK